MITLKKPINLFQTITYQSSPKSTGTVSTRTTKESKPAGCFTEQQLVIKLGLLKIYRRVDKIFLLRQELKKC